MRDGMEEAMEAFWFWFLVLTLVTAVLALPYWPYTRDRGLYRRRGLWPYAPSGAAAGVAIGILILLWIGLIVLAPPWHPTGG